MLSIILLSILQLGLALNPAAFRQLVKDCEAKVEDVPWHIADFITFERKPASNHSSFMAFHFADTNNRLEMNTTCIRTIPPDSTATLGSTGKTLCDDKDVAFEWDGKTLELSRWYTDKWCVIPVGTLVLKALSILTIAWPRSLPVQLCHRVRSSQHQQHPRRCRRWRVRYYDGGAHADLESFLNDRGWRDRSMALECWACMRYA